MIAAWMAYSVAVAGGLGLAALALEAVAVRFRWPTRWLWCGALLGSLVLPVIQWYRPPAAKAVAVSAPPTAARSTDAWSGAPSSVATDAASPGPSPSLGTTEPVLVQGGAPSPMSIAARPTPARSLRAAVVAGIRGQTRIASAALRAADPVLGLLWGSASFVLFIWLVSAHRRLAAARRDWHEEMVDGTAVLVSRGVGPAVIGVLRGRIVLPAWALSLDRSLQELMLLHESEHLRARDPQLVGTAALGVVLFPWNVALWWQVRRLRLAVEVDCDTRVLRRRPDIATYGALLLDVSQAGIGTREPFLLSLFQSRRSLERRIQIMTGLGERVRWSRIALCVMAGVVAGAMACRIPVPEARSAPSRTLRNDARGAEPFASVFTATTNSERVRVEPSNRELEAARLLALLAVEAKAGVDPGSAAAAERDRQPGTPSQAPERPAPGSAVEPQDSIRAALLALAAATESASDPLRLAYEGASQIADVAAAAESIRRALATALRLNAPSDAPELKQGRNTVENAEIVMARPTPLGQGGREAGFTMGVQSGDGISARFLGPARDTTQPGSAPGVLSGKVLDFNTTQPIAGALVSLVPVGGGASIHAVSTDSVGRFLLLVPTAGRYQIGFTRTGYRELTSFAVTIATGERTVLVLSVPPAAGAAPTLGAPQGALQNGATRFDPSGASPTNVGGAQPPVPEQRLTAPELEYGERFTNLYSIAELSGDRVIVVARNPAGPTLVNLSTGTATPIGREGQGPGEWSSVVSVLRFRADTTLLYDLGRRALLVVTPQGAISLQGPYQPIASTGSTPQIGGLWIDLSLDTLGRTYYSGVVVTTRRDAAGNVVTVQGPTAPPGVALPGARAGVRDSVAVTRQSPLSAKADTLGYLRLHAGSPRVQMEMSDGRSSIVYPAPGPFAAIDLVAVGRDGRVAIVRSPEYRVDWVLPDGRRVSGAPISHQVDSVTSADWAIAGARVGSFPASGSPLVKPPVRAASISPAGELWVERAPTADDRVPLVDVIDTAGRLVRRVRLPERTRLVGFGEGTVYLVRMDSYNYEYLQRYRLP